MNSLIIDLETFSDVDITKAGAYKYAESPAFEILLFGVSVDEGPVTVYDLCSGETIPEEILAALSDEHVKKWAYNASFERICLSTYLKRHYPQYFRSYGPEDDSTRNYLDPASWYCAMVWSAYNGLPLPLEGCGAALGLKEQKLKEGKDLIRYFCIPCKPTKTNGGRTRNLPEHAPEKWTLFKSYNQRDVEVELQIQLRLQNYPVPDFVWDEYHLDQQINDRGIMIDQTVVEQAIRIDALSKADLTERMVEKTDLENPNSVMQLQSWLKENGHEMDTLGKKEVAAAVKEAPDKIADVLSLRLQLAKSSVKKYQAMENAVCGDGRCHGMFQFYGANRSGRWAGRLIQLQNLPQNHMPDLEQARALVKEGDYEMLRLLYDNIPQVLSELIRTAFVPRPGYKFIVADFSAIEARVLSHLAGETWRSDVFRNNGDIYCMSASQMFGVPVEKHGVNGHLRQKGKIAELACIAEGSLVLTDKGLVPIEQVTTDHLLWDGESWVHHDGIIYKGEREVISYEGLTATPDHLVWVEGEPEPVQFGIAAASGAHLIQTGNGRSPIRLGEDYQSGKKMEQKLEPLLCSDRMSGMWKHTMAVITCTADRQIKRLSTLLSASNCTEMAGEKAYCCQTEMRKSKCPRIQKLRSTGDSFPISVSYISRFVPHSKIWDSKEKHGNRPDQHKRGLCSWQYSLRNTYREQCKQIEYRIKQIRTSLLALFQISRDPEVVCGPHQRRDNSRCRDRCIREKKKLADNKRTARLYDIRNAGRHHRFTVSDKLVHNCGYGGSVGALKAMGALDMGLAEEELKPLVDMWRQSNPNIVRYWYQVDTAVKNTVKLHSSAQVGDISFFWKSGMLFITLPSGRNLAYVKPQIGMNRFGGESVTYMGTDASKKWSRIESYGPKFVENIIQGISRDILCFAMKTLSKYRIVGHVHDEVIIECPMGTELKTICDQMGQTPPWIPGLLLRADGYECPFYKKD